MLTHSLVTIFPVSLEAVVTLTLSFQVTLAAECVASTVKHPSPLKVVDSLEDNCCLYY